MFGLKTLFLAAAAASVAFADNTPNAVEGATCEMTSGLYTYGCSSDNSTVYRCADGVWSEPIECPAPAHCPTSGSFCVIDPPTI